MLPVTVCAPLDGLYHIGQRIGHKVPRADAWEGIVTSVVTPVRIVVVERVTGQGPLVFGCVCRSGFGLHRLLSTIWC